MNLRRFSLGSMVTNSYILFDEEEGKAVIFDAPEQSEKILTFIREKSLKVEYIFLTHAHFDHIMSLEMLIRATCAKVILHEEEKQYLNDTSLNLSNVELPFIEPDILTKDGDIFDFCGTSIKVIHTPGHTVGSACYLYEETLISGDTLFLRSIGRSDFPLGNFEDEIRSIKEKLMILDDSITVCPGHGFTTSIGRERKENPYLI